MPRAVLISLREASPNDASIDPCKIRLYAQCFDCSAQLPRLQRVYLKLDHDDDRRSTSEYDFGPQAPAHVFFKPDFEKIEGLEYWYKVGRHALRSTKELYNVSLACCTTRAMLECDPHGDMVVWVTPCGDDLAYCRSLDLVVSTAFLAPDGLHVNHAHVLSDDGPLLAIRVSPSQDFVTHYF